MLSRSPKGDSATGGSEGLGRLSKTVLVVYLLIMSILVLDVLVNEGIGKDAVGPIGALIIGVIIVIRDWRPRSS